MFRRMCLAGAVASSIVGAATAAGAGEIPYAGGPNNGGQVGCIVTENPWAVGADGDPLTPPFGPFDGAAVSAAAPSNTCGQK